MGGVAKTPGQELCSLLRPHEGNPEPGDMALLGLSSPPDAGLHVIHEDMQTRCDDPHLAGERAEALQGQHFAPKQGKELTHPNHVFLTQGLCAHPCLTLYSFSSVCWKVVRSLVEVSMQKGSHLLGSQFQAAQEG